jgi:hypothetical protein
VPPATPAEALDRLRDRLTELGLWSEGQIAGRRWPMGCISLEVTQRCNLDCTLCYLSEHSEAVRDIPLEEIYRRIDMIRAHYGEDADVQVSGGEPTLRRRDELFAIVRRIASRGMRATLFTNGILATRELLEALVAAGLTDVAFHVDLTQSRKGYATEMELNALRDRYIGRARGLPLSVFFNTTVFEGNLEQVPELVRFFASRAEVVRVASFQLQADTGRGVLGRRAESVSVEGVVDRIRRGAGVALDFEALAVGHPACNRYAMAWEIAGRLHDAFADRAFVHRFMSRTADMRVPRTSRRAAVAALLAALARKPDLWAASLRWLFGSVWRARRDLVASRGRVNKISFFVHNFMDACDLDPERLHACVFMAATQDGPLPMCAYNARRDEFLLRPIALSDGTRWQPTRSALPIAAPPAAIYPIKFLKGRARILALDGRKRATCRPGA